MSKCGTPKREIPAPSAVVEFRCWKRLKTARPLVTNNYNELLELRLSYERPVIRALR